MRIDEPRGGILLSYSVLESRVLDWVGNGDGVLEKQ
jgi:hypothetical protein